MYQCIHNFTLTHLKGTSTAIAEQPASTMKLRCAALPKRPRARHAAIALVTGGLVATRSSDAFINPSPRHFTVVPTSHTSNLLSTPTQSTFPLFSSPSQLPPLDAEVVDEHRLDQTTSSKPKSTDPTPVLMKAVQQLVGDTAERSPLGPTTAVAAAALSLALLLSPLSANAAMSGGRLGGSFPSQSRQSYSRPSAPSYGRGYSQGFRSGYGSGYYSRPSITVAPFVSPFGGGFSPFFSPFPRPFYYGSPGVITYSRGPSFLDLLVFGGISFVIFNAVRSAASGVKLADSTSSWAEAASATSALGSGTSVVQLSVALEVPNRDSPTSILSVLDRLSQTARTDSRVGLQNLTNQVALELLRRKSSIVSAATRYKHHRDRTKAERDFNALSVQERGKFEQETVSKYGGVDYTSGKAKTRLDQGGPASQATVAVVTLLLAIDGDSTKVPAINSIQDVEDALRRIAADSKVDSCLQTAEILWTPEDRSETLTLRDVIADYPQLRAV